MVLLHSHGQEKDMKTAKEEVREIINRLPDDISLEEIQYHIYVHQKILRGLKDVKEGRVFSNEEMKKRIAKWLEK
jgi:hypothetical protein